MKIEILRSDVPVEFLNAQEEECIGLHGTASPNGYNLNRPSRQPHRGGNHANLKAAVQAYNAANPEQPKAKVNGKASVQKRRSGWEQKRIKRCEGMTEAQRWAEYVKVRTSAKYAARNASVRCAGTGRDPMAEWEAQYGSDTDERKAHVAYQRRMRGRAKGDSSRCEQNSPLPASSASENDTREYALVTGSSSGASFPKFLPSATCSGEGTNEDRSWMIPSDSEDSEG